MDRNALKQALQSLGEAQEDAHDWAYALADGQLRCPDCNSDAVFEGRVADGPLPWSGAVIVTTECCSDCGVVLSEDGACAPAYVAYSALRSWDMYGADSFFQKDWEAEARLLLA